MKPQTFEQKIYQLDLDFKINELEKFRKKMWKQHSLELDYYNTSKRMTTEFILSEIDKMIENLRK
jgi:hypothetical protein